ncbi:MAG: aldehyde dehydrogenase family protein [Chitinophagaceae bacterium]|nr:aldehyde dehydrogenase family protein [Chitinophagaceae bacterium]
MEPERVSTNLLNFPSSSRIVREPLGVVFIIGPWNYPFQLVIAPLISAIAAGNCAVVKAGEAAVATDNLLRELITETFADNYIAYAQGEGAEVVPALLKQFQFDHIFFTGGIAAGKAVYQLAAEKLVPVTLELGGKSPAIVEADADIAVAARRIASTKFSNSGQMCVAVDYILVHESRKEELISALKKCIRTFYGENPADSYNYGRMINARQFDRVVSYLTQGTIVAGGGCDRNTLYIEPTILTDVAWDNPVMQEEIFGPLLPIIGFTDEQGWKPLVARNPNPLAAYIFTKSKAKQKQWMEELRFGGGCVNNASWHLTNPELPFGGRGFSGTGRYHGKFGFDTFSHPKSVMKTPTWFDPKIKYPPMKGKLGLFKRFIR